MRRSVLYIGLAVLAYLGFLAVTAPATLLADAVASATQARIAIAEPVGSFWRGEGRVSLALGDATKPLGTVHWEVKPLALFTGRLTAQVSLDSRDVAAKGIVGLGLSDVSVGELSVAASAELLESMLAPGMWGAGGQVQLEAMKLTAGPAGVQGNADLYWRDASNRFCPVRPFGDYRMRVNAQGKKFAFSIDTLNGALAVDGEGAWNVDEGRLRFNGTAQPVERRAELEPLLELFGADAGAGRRNLALTLPLR